jgi:hypothetical protein
MADNFSWLLLATGAVAYFAGWCIGQDRANKVYETNMEWRKKEAQGLEQRENQFRNQLKRETDAERSVLQKAIADDRKKLQKEFDEKSHKLESELEKREKGIQGREQTFHYGILSGRKWLASMIAEAEAEIDESRVQYLLQKQHPAPTSAQIVRNIKAEKRQLREELKFLEYQLRSYEEYFPFLEEYRDAILDEAVPLIGGADNVQALEHSDPVLRFVPKDQYDKMEPAERNQLALERYLAKKNKKPWEIGRQYERYIGYYYEQQSWKVTYQGALKGLEDFGRDLICRKDNKIKVVQAKYWRQGKTIREKHIFQLFGTTILLRSQNPSCPVQAVFCSTTDYSQEARDVAKALKVNLRIRPFDDNYPMIKCNINPSTGEKIYHLPMDQQYDRTVIGAVDGECYTKTCEEAEKLGFRRAFKWHGEA